MRATHRDPGHASVEKQIKVIENAGIENLSSDTRIELRKIVRDPMYREFSHNLLVGNVVSRGDRNVRTRFISGCSIQNKDADKARRSSKRCYINV